MFSGLELEHQNFTNEFEEYGKLFFDSQKIKDPQLSLIWDSMFYSFSNGGKRFRPFLVYLISQTEQKDFSLFKSWATAIEMIHTYSLIHDDLPCMDNDDFRRGLPTNHKKFGEDIALLAGDGLQSEAFGLIASDLMLKASVQIRLVQILSKNIGVHGMVGGQALDMKSNAQTNLDQLRKIHELKTGCLIQAAVVGAAVLAEVSDQQLSLYEQIGHQLGLAFQIKDDLLDGLDPAQDHKSYLALLGIKGTQELLQQLTQSLLQNCQNLHKPSAALQKLISFNLTREK